MAMRTKSRSGSRPGARGRAGARNYMTPQGYARLKEELTALLDRERPELVKIIAWAASNGDRSENADYIYGKRRLREIDRRIHYLTKGLDTASVVDPAAREATDRVFFGATVTYCNAEDEERTITIVGIDEADPARGHVSWISPIARALLGRRRGDAIVFTTPAGAEEIEITDVRYTAVS
jgi:transcription elongation factor GreB